MGTTEKSIRYFFSLCLCIWITSASRSFAQSANYEKHDRYFHDLYSHIRDSFEIDYKSGASASKRFSAQFIDFVRSNPQTLDYNFKLLDSNQVFIETSKDRSLRVYSWDACTGGTMHEYNTMYQWRENKKIFTRVEFFDAHGDPGSFIVKLYSVNDKINKVYLAVSTAIYSDKDHRQSVQAFQIRDGKLIDTGKVFKAKRQILNRIDIDYDFFSVVNRSERPICLISYDPLLKKLYIPLVNYKEQVTDKRIVYQFKEGLFIFTGIRNNFPD